MSPKTIYFPKDCKKINFKIRNVMVISRKPFILFCLFTALFFMSIYSIEIGKNFEASVLFFTSFFLILAVRSRLGSKIDAITLSLLLFILYFCVNIFSGIFDGGLWRTCLLFAEYVLSPSQVKTVWYVLWTAVIGVLFGTLLFKNRRSFKEGGLTERHEIELENLQLPEVNRFATLALSVTVLVGLSYTSSNVALQIISEGYAFLFRSYDDPLIQWHHRLLLLGQVLAFLMPGVSIKNGIKLKYLGLVGVGVAGLMVGQKIWIVTSIIYIIWFRFSLIRKSPNRVFLAFMLVLLVFLAGVFNETRAGRTGGGILIALNGTSNSYCTIPYLDEITDKRVYLFAPITDRISRIFDSNTKFNAGWDNILERSSNLSYHLTAAINPIAFKNGNGTGTSLLAEAYSFGGLGSVFFMYVIATMALLKTQRMIENKHQRLLYLPLLLMHFLDIHRDSFFDFIPLVPYLLVAYLLATIRLKNSYKYA